MSCSKCGGEVGYVYRYDTAICVNGCTDKSMQEVAEGWQKRAEKAEAEIAELKEVNAKQEEEIKRLTEMIEK